jgi:hypothetical protein
VPLGRSPARPSLCGWPFLPSGSPCPFLEIPFPCIRPHPAVWGVPADNLRVRLCPLPLSDFGVVVAFASPTTTSQSSGGQSAEPTDARSTLFQANEAGMLLKTKGNSKKTKLTASVACFQTDTRKAGLVLTFIRRSVTHAPGPLRGRTRIRRPRTRHGSQKPVAACYREAKGPGLESRERPASLTLPCPFPRILKGLE